MRPRPWVCLMYHDVVPGSVHATDGPRHFAVSRRTFASQLDVLVGEGYTGTSVAEALVGRGPRPVAITFDDGDAGQFEHAFPELVSRNLTATFFLTTSWIGTPGYMTWDQARELQQAGMSIQSHTHGHPFLSELSPAAVRDELHRSKMILDTELEQVTDTLALPNGDHPRRAARACLAELGYNTVATSRWGRNHPDASSHPQYLHRCTVRGEPHLDHFRRTVAGDPILAATRGAREWSLNSLRRALGPSRYRRWRRTVLGALAHNRS